MERVLHVVEVADLEVAVDRSNCFGASIMFFTSGRPTRSIRTLNSPRVSVSATTPTSSQPGRKPVSISTTRLSTFLPSRKIDPGSVNASLPRRDRLQGGAGVHDERVPADAGEDPHAAPGTALLVVHAEGDRARRRRRAGPLLLVVRSPRRSHVLRARRTRSRRRTPRRRRRTAHRIASWPPRRAGATGSGRRARPRTASAAARTAGCSARARDAPGRSGLGNAYTSVMSAIGSARARGPEMWSDMRLLVAAARG